MADDKIYAIVDYEDSYVHPLLLEAIKSRIPSDLLVLINDISELPSPSTKLLQWRQYESIDFEHVIQNKSTSLANSYVIRKALIRKHYLASTVEHWLAKHPDSVLRKHVVQPSVGFEVDYAEFLDDALDEAEAWALRDSLERNVKLGEEEKEWWILKPGMSDRGQGIRLFSSEEELQEMFEGWEAELGSEDENDDAEANVSEAKSNGDGSGVPTSQLRHFIAQPYIQPPLLLPSPHPSAERKFHIRTYVLATGALKIYVYKPMLALFAAKSYEPPSSTTGLNNDNLPSHLTNTCLQSTGEREGSVHAFWSLPASHSSLPSRDWRSHVFDQICKTTSALFEAAARSMTTHFQPLPNAFELFGLDFLVDAEGTAWLLEVNAFPDFAQTGDELQSLVQGLVEAVCDVAIKPFFGLETANVSEGEQMVQVLDIDLGRR